MNYGLEEKILQQIVAVFKNFPEIDKAIVYGSRAKGNFRPASDIDLTLEGENLSPDLLNKLSWELDDLLLPYTFDLSLHKQITQQDLLDHIERVGKEFYIRKE
jgi:uncharacterized protein